MTCEVDALPAAKYTISHNGRNLTSVTNGVYTIHSINFYHNAKYECVAENYVGAAKSSLVLNVKSKFIFHYRVYVKIQPTQ